MRGLHEVALILLLRLEVGKLPLPCFFHLLCMREKRSQEAIDALHEIEALTVHIIDIYGVIEQDYTVTVQYRS